MLTFQKFTSDVWSGMISCPFTASLSLNAREDWLPYGQFFDHNKSNRKRHQGYVCHDRIYSCLAYNIHMFSCLRMSTYDKMFF